MPPTAAARHIDVFQSFVTIMEVCGAEQEDTSGFANTRISLQNR